MEFEFRAEREAHLRMLCEQMGRTVEDFITEAVLTLMEDYEEGRDAQVALYEGGPTYTQEEMEREFGLDLGVPELHKKTA